VAEFTLNREEFREAISFPVEIFRSDSGAEQRRLRISKELRRFRIKSPFLTKAGLAEYVDFFLARYGPWERLTFRNPNNDILYDVRFDGSMNITFHRGLRSCSFGFELTNQLGS